MIYGPLIESTSIQVPWLARPVTVELRATHRPGGRRMVAKEGPGIVIFDSGDQYDAANAQNAFDLWYAGELAKSEPLNKVVIAEAEQGGGPVG